MEREELIKRMVRYLDQMGVLDKDNYNSYDEQMEDVNISISKFLKSYTLVSNGVVY